MYGFDYHAAPRIEVYREVPAGKAPRYETRVVKGLAAFSRHAWAVALYLPDRDGAPVLHHLQTFYGNDREAYQAARIYAARARAGRMQFTRYRSTHVPIGFAAALAQGLRE
ncbi:hypothetical protein [Thauera sp.]|uniref:hypothetical protein n=1 Tax=Thauera sp. TaxID=1905334 RepID=UPI002B549AC7|nr:hypothetical protein [Thauera sp.]HRP25358.1 hypothetical protein [Thauera sp.]